MFNFIKLKNLLVLATLVVIANVSLYAAALEAEFYIDGKWRKGTLLSAADIVIKDGNATPTPPWAFVGEGDPPYTTGGNGSVKIPVRIPPPGGNNKISMSEIDISVSNYNGLDINYTEPLDVSIYDMSGKCVYSATDKKNIKVDRNTLTLTNGLYMLRLINKEGESQTMNFMFTDDAIIIGKPME